jgi:hypothetical protein
MLNIKLEDYFGLSYVDFTGYIYEELHYDLFGFELLNEPFAKLFF